MAKIVNYTGKWYLLTESSDGLTIEPLDANKAYEVKGTVNVRSTKQNASIHLYCTFIKQALNDGGFSIQKVVALFKKAEIEWTMLAVKDIIWRNIQIALTQKTSTTQLDSDEVTKVYKNVDYYCTGTIGIEHIEFPSEESMIFQQNYKDR